jgi:hypothetical protein
MVIVMATSALTVAGLATTTTAAAASPTQMTLTASNYAPIVNQPVTFKATLTSGGKPISKRITIYHYLNGKRYTDKTGYTTLIFTTKFTTPGVRLYYATFAGNGAYKASTSSKVTITACLGIMKGTGPAAAYGAAGSPVLVAVDTSGHVWWTGVGSKSGWSSIGGSATSSPAATTLSLNPSVVIDVFVRRTDGAVWYTATTNNGKTWSKWTSIGGQVAAGTGPAVCSWGAGRLDVFVEWTNGDLYHKWSTNDGKTWSGWQNLGGKLTSSPAASSPATNQIGVFARGTNGACLYKEWNGTAWSSWKSLGEQLAPNTGPGVMGGYEVFVQGTNHQLWWQILGEPGPYPFDNAWSNLSASPEALSASSPAVVFSYSGHTEVWVSTTSGNIMGCFWTGNWTPVNTWEWFYTEPSLP